MKTRNLWMLLLPLSAATVHGQTNRRIVKWQNEALVEYSAAPGEFKGNILKYDFSPLLIQDSDREPFGIIGDDYQRLRIKILTVVKDRNNPDTYAVTGKSMVKKNINRFAGTIKIVQARVLDKDGLIEYEADSGFKFVGLAFADFTFEEDRTQPGSGAFQGRMMTKWLIDKDGKLREDDVASVADGYSNNDFVGTWKSYRTGAVKIVSWGDHRVPMAPGLDEGVGDFGPADKYAKAGWQNYIDAYGRGNERARAEEERKWWK